MKNCLLNRRFLNILLLISLAGFLVLPNISLANDFDDITLREAAKHLELPAGKVQDLIHSFINIFHSEWMNLVGSGYVSAEKMAVPSIMKKAVQVQALNHLLIDAPIQTTLAIIKSATKIARIFLIKDFSGILDELEKESVKKAVGYGMSVLFENEIRMSPGAIEFEYKLREGEIGKALIQYIMIYKPFDAKNGEVVVKFYSAESLKPPENKGTVGMYKGTYTELEHDLPPFIVDIRGNVEDYKWVGKPSIDIDFPPEVPDLGIKPLTFWERYLLKPITSAIKEVEIIITKVTGKSPKITNIIQAVTDVWDKLKSTLSELNPFKATVVQMPEPPVEEIETKLDEIEETEEEVTGLEEELSEIVTPKVETEPEAEPKPLTLDEIQERLDDISERIDVISQEIIKLAEEKGIELAEEKGEEEEEQPEVGQEVGQKLCEKISGSYPARNKVIFNEVAWMGTTISASDEWMELKNISGTEIHLSGWQLLDNDQKIKILFNNGDRISINGFLLLERTDDETVPNIPADFIYTGALSNQNEALYLFDGNCQLQDEVIASPNWPAGDNASKRTMERRTDFSWQTSAYPGGTPKKENSSGYYEYYSGGGGGAPTPPPSEPSPPPKILITEIQI